MHISTDSEFSANKNKGEEPNREYQARSETRSQGKAKFILPVKTGETQLVKAPKPTTSNNGHSAQKFGAIQLPTLGPLTLVEATKPPKVKEPTIRLQQLLVVQKT
jgi:hypothetical protein